MDEEDFEGTEVLERLAEAGRLEPFSDAVDADDIGRATSILRHAGLDEETIAIVVEKMEAADRDA